MMSEPLKQRDMYETKAVSYYGNPRADYINLLPDNQNLRILEIGCGNGATGALALQLNKCVEYVGIEMFESEGAKAKNLLSEVHIGNVETMALPYPSDYFDVLIASEVLEHLVDPYETVRRLCALVKPGGRILASSPNISWFGNIVGLIKGKFEYEEEGMMDRTHLRWFTPASYAAMFVEAGVRVDRLAPLAAVTGKNARRKRWISYVFGNRFDHIWWYQINFHGTRIAHAPK
jgi:2-polyprenyl-3-methyl-5-hydroxy-6-metoxy-1,4-benzoquinol methylase